MSVVVQGVKMPTSCSECAFCRYYGKGDHVCDITGKDVVYELSLENRLDDCPLVELPAQHGRLIDGDLLVKVLKRCSEDKWNKEASPFSWSYAYECVMDIVEDMPTVIEAEEGEVSE